MAFLPPLFATEIATAPLLGVSNETLLYWTLPMIVAGAGVFYAYAFFISLLIQYGSTNKRERWS